LIYNINKVTVAGKCECIDRNTINYWQEYNGQLVTCRKNDSDKRCGTCYHL